MVRFSPLASYAAQLLQSPTIRIAEPSEGMGSFAAEHGRRRPKDGAGHENCGHTAYHRDDSYFPIRADPAIGGIAVAREPGAAPAGSNAHRALGLQQSYRARR